MATVIIMERCEKIGEVDSTWWKENMPTTAKYTPTYQYVKRGLRSLDIKSVIEIPKNSNECMVLCYDGEEIIVKGTFSTVYEQWVESENFEDDEFN